MIPSGTLQWGVLSCSMTLACVAVPNPTREDRLESPAPDAASPEIAADANEADGTITASDAATASKLVPNTVLSGKAGTTILNGVLQLRFGQQSGDLDELIATASAQKRNLLYLGETPTGRSAGVLYWDSLFSYNNKQEEPNTLLRQGPVAVQLQHKWTTHAAGSPTQTMSGITLYTIYPDGRVHRQENFRHQTTKETSFVTGYVALRTDSFSQLSWDLAEGQESVDIRTSDSLVIQSDELRGYLCATGPYAQVGWMFAPMDDVFVGVRSYFTKEVGQFALQADWIRQYPLRSVPNPPEHAGALLMHVSPPNVGDCANLASVAAAFQRPRLAIVERGTLIRDHVGDFDGDGYSEGRGHYTIQTDATEKASFRFDNHGDPSRTPAPTTVVAFLGFQSANDLLVLRDGVALTSGVEYLVQQDDSDGTVWLYFPVPLDDSQVEVRPKN